MHTAFQRLASEWQLSCFAIADVKSNNRIDIDATFGLATITKLPHRIALALFKATSLLVTSYAIYASILAESPSKVFWLAYLTHLTTLASVLSLFCSLTSFLLHTVRRRGPRDKLTTFHKVTWGLFTTSSNMQMFCTVMYAALVSDYSGPRNMTFHDVYEHGILFLILLVDGFAIHRFPIRLKQIWFVYAVCFCYVSWTVVHYAVDVGNPNWSDNDPETDDDALYSAISWKKRPESSVIQILLFFVVAVPSFFLALWCVSLVAPKYYASIEDEEEAGNDTKPLSGGTATEGSEEKEEANNSESV